MHRFTSAVWVIVQVGFVLTVIPVVIFVLTQLVPALLTTSSNAWVK